MEITREQNIASFFVVPLIDRANRPSYKASPTLAAGDVKIIRHTGGSWNVANVGTLPSAISGATTQILVTLTATELNPDNTKYPIIIQFIDAAGSEWDDQTVIIWTRPVVSNMAEINGGKTDGNNATLKLKQLDITNSAGTAAIIKSTGSNGIGMDIAGQGTGDAIRIIAGSVSGNGINIAAYGEASGGSAIYAKSWTHCVYIESIKNDGVRVFGSSDGTAVGHGILLKATHVGSFSVKLEGTGGCIDAYTTSGNCVVLQTVSNGSCLVIEASGSGAQQGIRIVGQTGIDINGGSGNGITVIGDGHAIELESQGAGKHGLFVHAYEYSGNGNGIHAQGGPDGNGLRCLGGTGRDIYAKEIGLPVSLGDGASLADNMTSLAGKTASAGSYDRTTDSQEAIRDRGDAAWVTGGSGLTSQQVRDAMKLTPSGGAPASGSVDEHLDDLLTDTTSIKSSVESIQNNTRLVVGLPAQFDIPETSYNVYKVIVNFYDTDGNMEDPDDNEFSIDMETAGAVDKNGLLYKEVGCSNLLDASVKFSGYKALVREDIGRFYCFVKIVSTETPIQIMYDFACEETAISLHYTRSNSMEIQQETTVELEDSTINKFIIAKALKDQDISAVSAVTGSIFKDFQIDIADLPQDILNSVIDGMTVSDIFELVAAMVNGRIRKDYPAVGDLTFYKRNNTTILTITHTTATERTRV